MKKSPVMIALLLAGSLWALHAQAQAAAPQQQKKEIKDPAEYNSYINAAQASDPNTKAASFEAYLQQYPNSVFKEEALESLMQAYQQANNGAKVQDAAQRLLQVNPKNLSALAVMAFFKRSQAETPGQSPQQVQQLAGEALQYAQQGLQALQSAQAPDGVSAADFQKRRDQLQPLFNSVAGFGALQTKDYAAAQQYLGAVVQQNPNDLASVYPLTVAYLEQKPVNPVGFWYGARAVALATGQPGFAQISQYVKSRYRRYHGGDDGFDQLVAAAKASPTPPANFTVAPAPTPSEEAAKMMQSTQIKDMQFADFQFILTSGNQQAADQLWAQIKGKPIAMEAKLITASASKLALAGSGDDIDANKADVDLTMKDAIPAKAMTVVQTGQMIQFQGTPQTYDPNPFMMHMDAGAFVGETGKAIEKALNAKKPAAGKAGARKGTARKKK